ASHPGAGDSPASTTKSATMKSKNTTSGSAAPHMRQNSFVRMPLVPAKFLCGITKYVGGRAPRERSLLFATGRSTMIPRGSYRTPPGTARHEAHRKSLHRPPYYLHKWWARRTGTVVRGILLDMLLPDGDDLMESFYRRHDFRDMTVLDPFMGGGTTL